MYRFIEISSYNIRRHALPARQSVSFRRMVKNRIADYRTFSPILNNADRLVGDEGDDRRVSDECGARDQIEAAGHQHHQESRALTAETLPAGATLQGAVCGLLGSVKHAGNDEAGDVVHAHEDQERGQSCVPASEKTGDEAAHDSHCCANSSFHVVYPRP